MFGVLFPQELVIDSMRNVSKIVLQEQLNKKLGLLVESEIVVECMLAVSSFQLIDSAYLVQFDKYPYAGYCTTNSVNTKVKAIWLRISKQ